MLIRCKFQLLLNIIYSSQNWVFFLTNFFFVFLWKGFLSLTLTIQETVGEGRGPSLFLSTISTCLETFRNLFAIWHVRRISRIFNLTACNCQAATRWDLPLLELSLPWMIIWFDTILSANPTKWLNMLKQFASKLPTNCSSVFDHFVRLARKGLKSMSIYVYMLIRAICEIFSKLILKTPERRNDVILAQQTFVLMKTSWRRLSSLSSEEVFKTSSKRLN